jgi:hypothetical protein
MFAFDANDIFQRVYGQDDSVLRFGLTEREGNRKREMLKSRLSLIIGAGLVTIAIGNRISPNNRDQRLEELDRIAGHVNVLWCI